MDTMNTQNAYEQEIDLKDLMFVVLHKWKITIAIAMVFAILLGGVKGALTYRSESDPEVIEQREEDYQNALIQYERDTAAYNREIKNLTEDISNQEDYLNNSVLMNLMMYVKQEQIYLSKPIMKLCLVWYFKILIIQTQFYRHISPL